MVKPKTTSKLTSLFDIRLSNVDHDVVVLKGSEHTAASTFISGKIALSVTEPITVKKISLKLTGHMRLRFTEQNKQTPSRPLRFEKRIFEHVWDSADFAKYLGNMYSNTSGNSSSTNLAGSTAANEAKPPQPKGPNPLQMSKAHSLKGSTTSLKNLGFSFRSMSSTSLSHLAPSTHNSQSNSSTNLQAKASHILVSGNYEIPFSAILPGDMPESVEGLPGASVVYKLESTIDRGKFHATMISKKHVRVVRTMTTDSVELSETMAVDNTWPQKVEYSLSVPSKAIAIGSGTPISMMLVPLLKGLQLGEIRMSLVELSSYAGYIPPPVGLERIVCEKNIPPPREDDANFQMDRWEVTSFLRIPANLAKCTQDCDIQTHLKVRHKLKFVIELRNPDGHTSELRASLPVQLFISPFVGIRAHIDEEDEEPGVMPHEDEYLFASELTHSSSQVNLAEESSQNSSSNLQGSHTPQEGEPIRSNPHSVSSFTGLVAPPMYERHIYDRLWSDVSPMESPIASGAQTPRSQAARPGPAGDMLQFSMSAIDTAKLSENLRQLSIQRQLQENMEGSRATTPGRATFNLDGDNDLGDYFSRARPPLSHTHSASHVANGLLMSPAGHSPQHLSRANSELNLGNTSSTSMSKVPSYNEAMRSNVDDTLSPRYLPPLPGSQIDLAEVNRRFEENTSKSPPITSPLSHSRNRLFLSRGSSSFNLRAGSHNLSNNSSPSSSRDVSSSNLAAFGQESGSRLSKRNMKTTGSATFSMAP